MYSKFKLFLFCIFAVFGCNSGGLFDKYQYLLKYSTKDDCKEVHLQESRGSISSPGYPYGYHNHTSCTWYISVKTNELITLTFNDLDIEEDPNLCLQPPCCLRNWVKIIERRPGKKHFVHPQQLCGENGELPRPITILGKSITIKFETAMSVTGGRGFHLDYVLGSSCSDNQMTCRSGIGCYSPYEECNGHVDCPDYTDELGCGHCAANFTPCSSTSDFCYSPFTQRCNRFVDCPYGEDEMNCERGCEGKILCSTGLDCYSPEERCNGVVFCGDASDEKICSPNLCLSERGGFLCGNLHCVKETWCCDGTNDCGDGTDEINCLKNSVIAAAVIGSLICGLLLVVAISCSCKLYALRTLVNQPRDHPSRETPLSQLEREFMYREPPPSYAVATGDASMYYADTPSGNRERRSSRHHRRTRSHRQRAQNPRNPQVPELGGPLIIISPAVQRETLRNREASSSSNSGDRLSASSSESAQPEVHRVAKAPKIRAQPSHQNDPPEEPSIWRTELSGDLSNTSDVFPLLPS